MSGGVAGGPIKRLSKTPFPNVTDQGPNYSVAI